MIQFSVNYLPEDLVVRSNLAVVVNCAAGSNVLLVLATVLSGTGFKVVVVVCTDFSVVSNISFRIGFVTGFSVVVLSVVILVTVDTVVEEDAISFSSNISLDVILFRLRLARGSIVVSWIFDDFCLSRLVDRFVEFSLELLGFS